MPIFRVAVAVTVSGPAAGIFFRGWCVKRRLAIKRLARRKEQRPKNLLVLAEANDPFYIGSKSQYTRAEWAAQLYRLLAPENPIHIRRLHYFALTQPQHQKPDGSIYRNTETDWKFLGCACKFARYLNILPYDAFIDRRNLFGPMQNAALLKYRPPCQWPGLMAQTVERLCRIHVGFMIAKLMPVHIEIWVEKSTAADLINPVTEKYHVNIITSMGDITLTAVWQFIKRITDLKKPIRVFYISDFDPAGENMPIGAARKIEFLLRQQKLGRKLDVKLKPLMLTRRQCKQFNLPGIPLPKKPTKGISFIRNHGRTASELHALEVTKPGYIHYAVDKQIRLYLDLSKITHAAKIADAAIAQFADRIENMVNANITMPALFQTIEKIFEQTHCLFDCDLNTPWLFDSQRDYLTQLANYQLQKMR